MTIEVSLIVCTHNRAAQLEACLRAVGRIRCAVEWEVIVVNNASDDDGRTQAVISEFFEDYQVNGKHLWEPVDNVCRAKNAAVSTSRGKILAFTDDDCYPATDWPNRIYDVFSDPHIGFMGGRILLYDTTDAPVTTDNSTEVVRFHAGEVVPCGAIHGCNMAMRRRAFLAVGGYDTTFGPGTPFAGEDWDIAARICASGWDGGYFPDPVVFHHHGRKAAQVPKLLKYYHYGSGAVFAKLVAMPATRRMYIKHWARRVLGDAKSQHWPKLFYQFRGALAYCRKANRGKRNHADEHSGHPAAG